MAEEVDTYQQFNFEIALEKIETLTKHNNELLDLVDNLKSKLQEKDEIKNSSTFKHKEYNRMNDISSGADEAMKRYQIYLKKEFYNAKPKQSKGKPV
tara:strand:- start:19 stop:309 length:291 start_codon:yes stop_codon:yes gene_type:complete